MSTIETTFADAKGTEANQHAKKLAKAKSSKKAKQYETVYSRKGYKVVKVVVKPNGVYQEYIGNLTKKGGEAEALKTQIEIWKKEKVWFEEFQLEDYTKSQLQKLTK